MECSSARNLEWTWNASLLGFSIFFSFLQKDECFRNYGVGESVYFWVNLRCGTE